MKEGNSDRPVAADIQPIANESKSSDTNTSPPKDLFNRLFDESPNYRFDIDKDDSKSFSKKELDDTIQNPATKPALKDFSQTLKDNFELVGNLDNADGQKGISHRDAYKLHELHSARKEADTMTGPVADVVKSNFKEIDLDGDGKLSVKELQEFKDRGRADDDPLKYASRRLANWMEQRDKFDDKTMNWASKDGITLEGLDKINAKDVATVLQKSELNKPRVEMTTTNSLRQTFGGTPKETQETVAQTNERYGKLRDQGLDKLLDRLR